MPSFRKSHKSLLMHIDIVLYISTNDDIAYSLLGSRYLDMNLGPASILYDLGIVWQSCKAR